MAKKYTEQLGEWVQHRSAPRQDKNVVAFLAVQDDVASALDAGHTVMTIWKNMREGGRIEVCYDTFLNYTNKFIRRPGSLTPTPRAAAKPKPGAAARKHRAADSEPAATQPAPAGQPGFTFNAVPRKEDLL